MSNPDWTRDELILLLELYLRLDSHDMSPKSHDVMKLSRSLRKLPIHPPSIRDRSFRNPVGISMKLRNLQRLDPGSIAAGLPRGGRLEVLVWEEFSNDADRLVDTTQSIRDYYDKLHGEVPAEAYRPGPGEYEEGRIVVRVHQLRERNSTAIQRKKNAVLRDTGRLQCEACGFAFCEWYGQLGEGFCECHHLVTLAALGRSRTTRLADLAIVCANCHRMLHRGIRWMSIHALGRLVSAQRDSLAVDQQLRHEGLYGHKRH